jgi:hypothetical protein
VRLHAIRFSPARDETKCALIVVSGSARPTLKARQLRLIYFTQSTGRNKAEFALYTREIIYRGPLVVIHHTHLHKEEEAPADGVPFLYCRSTAKNINNRCECIGWH